MELHAVRKGPFARAEKGRGDGFTVEALERMPVEREADAPARPGCGVLDAAGRARYW
jgi:hypothetical protein